MAREDGEKGNMTKRRCSLDNIESQLEHILTSSGFKGSTQMQNFLRYVVNKKLSGEEKQLKQYTIAVEALGQAESFDADTNPLVRIEAGRLRKKLEAYYLHEGKDDPYYLLGHWEEGLALVNQVIKDNP